MDPFNPSTTIKFDVPQYFLNKGSAVTLKIYDALGRKVSILVDGDATPGVHELSWDASRFPNGVYYYRLESEGYSETKKMVLVK